MAIFNSYVCVPEGIQYPILSHNLASLHTMKWSQWNPAIWPRTLQVWLTGRQHEKRPYGEVPLDNFIGMMGEDVEMHGFALSIFFDGQPGQSPYDQCCQNFFRQGFISGFGLWVKSQTPYAPCMVYLPTFGWFLGYMLVNIPAPWSICEPKAPNSLTRKMSWFLGTTKSKDESYSDASRNGVFFVCGQQASWHQLLCEALGWWEWCFAARTTFQAALQYGYHEWNKQKRGWSHRSCKVQRLSAVLPQSKLWGNVWAEQFHHGRFWRILLGIQILWQWDPDDIQPWRWCGRWGALTGGHTTSYSGPAEWVLLCAQSWELHALVFQGWYQY